MTDTQRDEKAGPDKPRPKGIGFGVFLVLAGVVLLAERSGWVPSAIDWLFPAILVAWGVSEIYERLK